MKLNIIKSIITLGLAALLGLLCFVIAKEGDNRNWISFVTATVSIFLCIGSAFACDYNCGARNVNIKVTASIFSIIVILANFIFSCFAYNVIVYPVIVLIFTVINLAIVYSLFKPKQ